MGNNTSHPKRIHSRLQRFTGRARQQGNATRHEESPARPEQDARAGKLCLVSTGLDLQSQNDIPLVRLVSAQSLESYSPGSLHFRETASLPRIFPTLPPHWFPFNCKHIPEIRSPHSYCFSPPPTALLYAGTATVWGLRNKKLGSLNKCRECLIRSLPKKSTSCCGKW